MIDLGPHAVFIVSAYAGVLIGVVALIAYAAVDARRVRAHLKDLDARGIRRRSETNS
jgi:heme exporter protein D